MGSKGDFSRIIGVNRVIGRSSRRVSILTESISTMLMVPGSPLWLDFSFDSAIFSDLACC